MNSNELLNALEEALEELRNKTFKKPSLGLQRAQLIKKDIFLQYKRWTSLNMRVTYLINFNALDNILPILPKKLDKF